MTILECNHLCNKNDQTLCPGADMPNEKCTINFHICDDKTVTEISSESGKYITTSYQVFPGIKLVYNDAHIQSYSAGVTSSAKPESEQLPISAPAGELPTAARSSSESAACGADSITGNIIEINHCREGRMECNFKDEFCYITPGDLLIACTDSAPRTAYFPLKHYHGISVLIDIDCAPNCLSCFLDDVTVQPKALAEKFCSKQNCFVARSNPSFQHIFSELYSVPQEIQKGYFKVKILELLLFLSALDTNQDELSTRTYSRTQVALAKEVSKYLMENMEERITLEQLSEHFHVSGTHIKNTFKGVYGVSLYSFIRTQKMESAAYLLEYTDKSILEIAGKHGYDNGSKFASAFRDVKGMAPNEYRNVNKKI